MSTAFVAATVLLVLAVVMGVAAIGIALWYGLDGPAHGGRRCGESRWGE